MKEYPLDVELTTNTKHPLFKAESSNKELLEFFKGIK